MLIKIPIVERLFEIFGFIQLTGQFRSHDCQPAEIEFADSFEESQLDVERREKNSGKKKTMVIWKNVLKHFWELRPIEHPMVTLRIPLLTDFPDIEGGYP